ncbi:c-type cytochrome [Parasulfitobacter algicola]|uniref:Cytochrome c n=1 Tax=Parasulfitobacter algicola TaxID=2614809 RepID=A0ABX2IL74_9RHOB|nr:cytochrome c [Sulfitobacter algicola]NSX53612.1 cytochrome c [Sulfitobacter algicola]
MFTRFVVTFVLSAMPVLAQNIDEGRQIFLQNCATCHGVSARGDGPMTGALTTQPPDLTQLNANNEGVFPRVRVVFRIDGRDPIMSHGGPMPMFGYMLDGKSAAMDAEDGTPILTSEMMVDIVSYLESIQR